MWTTAPVSVVAFVNASSAGPDASGSSPLTGAAATRDDTYAARRERIAELNTLFGQEQLKQGTPPKGAARTT